MTCRKSAKRDRGQSERQQDIANLFKRFLGFGSVLPVSSSSNYEATARKSVQRNQENEKRKKEGKFSGTSENVNRRVTRFSWLVRFVGCLRLHHRQQALM